MIDYSASDKKSRLYIYAVRFYLFPFLSSFMISCSVIKVTSTQTVVPQCRACAVFYVSFIPISVPRQ